MALLQTAWQSFLDAWPYSERTLFVTGMFVIHELTFAFPCALLFVAHHYRLWPQWRVNPKKYPSPDLLRHAVKTVAFNHIVMQMLGLYFAYPVFAHFGMRIQAPLPSLKEVVTHLAVYLALLETTFYWGHRLFHWRPLYQAIHKQHHKFYGVVGISAEYSHPVEDILLGIGTTLVGPALMGSHLVTILLWMLLRMPETVDAHSGYDFPFSPYRVLGASVNHELHHSMNKGNFGAFTMFWDRLCKTFHTKNHRENQKMQ